jgi:hypothetical protein
MGFTAMLNPQINRNHISRRVAALCLLLPLAALRLGKNRTPEDLIRYWLGHADETVTDGHSKLREDVE